MRILCIGSFNRDIVYQVDHFAAGGETIHAASRAEHWGGKGLNQALAAARAGAEVYMAGCAGRADRSALEAFLQENGIDGSRVRWTDAPTGHAMICVDPAGQNSILVYGGSNRMLDEAFVREALEGFGKGDLLVVQNETSALEHILPLAAEKGMLVAMNPSPFTDDLLALPLETVDLFLVNEIEGAQLTGKSQPAAILDGFAQRFPQASVVLTLGGSGAVMQTADGRRWAQGVYRVPVADTTAAGDTFTGFLLAALAAQQTPQAMLEQASRAAAIAVSRPGAASSIPCLCELEDLRAEYCPLENII